jgi:hypothetical protein
MSGWDDLFPGLLESLRLFGILPKDEDKFYKVREKEFEKYFTVLDEDTIKVTKTLKPSV